MRGRRQVDNSDQDMVKRQATIIRRPTLRFRLTTMAWASVRKCSLSGRLLDSGEEAAEVVLDVRLWLEPGRARPDLVAACLTQHERRED